MSSPVTKLRKFSKLFSPRPLSPRSVEIPPTTAEAIHRFAPGVSNSPTARSTPKIGNKRLYNTSRTKCSVSDQWSFVGSEVDLASDVVQQPGSASRYSFLPNVSRKRHFGISDLPERHRRNKGHDTINQSKTEHTKKCSVFSASVAPASTPNHGRHNRSQILRLSGVALSPSSVSWSSQSPVSLASFSSVGRSTSPPCQFQWKRNFGYGVTTSLRHTKRLQEAMEQCPSGKFYFWEDDESELITAEQLGRGGFGRVFEGRYRGEKVAIKKIENAFKSRQAVLETLQGEMNGLRLRHENIVRTLVVVQPTPSPSNSTRSYCYIVMEHAGNKNLSQLINDCNEPISPNRRYRFAADILKALVYLHGKYLVHLDLKPSNVIVTQDDICKLCDFGSCLQITSSDVAKLVNKSLRDTNCNITGCSESLMSNSTMLSAPSSSKSSNESARSSSQLMGTFIYRAPELLRGLMPCSKADIYSFSITAWQLWSRVLPYAGQHNHATVFAVVAFGARPKIPQFSIESPSEAVRGGTSEERSYFDLVTSCWNADPDLRPPAEDALADIKRLIA